MLAAFHLALGSLRDAEFTDKFETEEQRAELERVITVLRNSYDRMPFGPTSFSQQLLPLVADLKHLGKVVIGNEAEAAQTIRKACERAQGAAATESFCSRYARDAYNLALLLTAVAMRMANDAQKEMDKFLKSDILDFLVELHPLSALELLRRDLGIRKSRWPRYKKEAFGIPWIGSAKPQAVQVFFRNYVRSILPTTKPKAADQLLVGFKLPATVPQHETPAQHADLLQQINANRETWSHAPRQQDEHLDVSSDIREEEDGALEAEPWHMDRQHVHIYFERLGAGIDSKVEGDMTRSSNGIQFVHERTDADAFMRLVSPHQAPQDPSEWAQRELDWSAWNVTFPEHVQKPHIALVAPFGDMDEGKADRIAKALSGAADASGCALFYMGGEPVGSYAQRVVQYLLDWDEGARENFPVAQTPATARRTLEFPGQTDFDPVPASAVYSVRSDDSPVEVIPTPVHVAASRAIPVKVYFHGMEATTTNVDGAIFDLNETGVARFVQAKEGQPHVSVHFFLSISEQESSSFTALINDDAGSRVAVVSLQYNMDVEGLAEGFGRDVGIYRMGADATARATEIKRMALFLSSSA